MLCLAVAAFIIGLVQTLQVSALADDPARDRVAIVGAGIGGSSAAHFLRVKRPDVDIVVFEKLPDAGGRIANVDVNGQVFEAGAAILHPRNQYMKNFTEMLGLQAKVDDSDSVGIFDGTRQYSLKSGQSWMAMLRDIYNMLSNWGFDFFRLDTMVGKLLDSFDNFYRVQEEGKAFVSVSDLLDAATPDHSFKELFQTEAVDAARSKWGLSQATVDLVLDAFSRINYNQGVANLNAFVMAVSLAGVQDGLWAVHGGNNLVCSGLLERAKVGLRHDAVTSVRHLPGSGSDPAKYEIVTRSGQSDTFDAVVLATPLQHSNIELHNFRSLPAGIKQGSYRVTFVTFVVGHPSKHYFALDPASGEPFPDVVISASNESVPLSCIGIPGSSILHEPVNNRSVWKLFSQNPLEEVLLTHLFTEYKHVVVREFHAYPDYATQPDADELPAFVLDDAVFYTSPIEWAASAMEMSALSGRNAALLVDAVLSKPLCAASDMEEHSVGGMYSVESNSKSCRRRGG